MTRFASPLFWTVGGYAASQVLRLMSNLIMARYLAPEDFGVMALIMVIIIGLQMFSDVGGSTYYIKSNDSEATSIANTVWTLRVLRGMGLFLICGLISWPISLVYENPILFEVLPAMGITFLISGVSSISVEKLERQMQLSRVTTLELFSQLISIFVMVAAARLFQSVWVLVLGAIVSTTAKTIGSYVFLEHYRHSFDLDKQKISKLVRFGAWVFVSTALAFFTNSSASLVVGKVFDMGFLGVFSIGATLAKAVEQVYFLVSARLYFPVLARVRNARGRYPRNCV